MKSFCRGHYLNENVKVVNKCFCVDYHYNFISRVPAKKGYKPKRIKNHASYQYNEDM